MDLPKRTKQQQSESHSYAVLLYKLRDLGIFRNLTENDYGIDFELELVRNDTIIGRTLKIQVKSAEKLKLRKDKSPAIGGIKQSTLNYWCELSFRTNVIAYAVDLSTETIYVSRNLFWQATKALDGGNASKSIDFFPAGADGDLTAKIATMMHAYAPTAADQVYAHILALRRLEDFLQLLRDAYHYDMGSEIHDPERFEALLEASSTLINIGAQELWSDPEDKKNWSKYNYWIRKSEAEGWDGLSYFAARPILRILVPATIKYLRIYKERVISAKYFWSHRNPQYLKLVYETEIPDVDDHQALIDWHLGSTSRRAVLQWDAEQFVLRARAPALKKTKKVKASPKS